MFVNLKSGIVGDSGARGSKNQPGPAESHKPDGKTQQENIHWHNKLGVICFLLQ